MPLLLPNNTEIALPEGMDHGQTSDGYHTFNELYKHRILLFVALMLTFWTSSWKSLLHHDGASFEGWFIAGMTLPTGKDITYHIPMALWNEVQVRVLEKAPMWDGHTSKDVLERLEEWVFLYH